MTCEVCGRPGRPMNPADPLDSWPLCNEHALAAMVDVERDARDLVAEWDVLHLLGCGHRRRENHLTESRQN